VVDGMVSPKASLPFGAMTDGALCVSRGPNIRTASTDSTGIASQTVLDWIEKDACLGRWLI
jgi:hypothetical protein